MNEKQQIEKLINDYPKQCVRMITKRSELWDWVEQNCDPNCITNVSKVYTAITQEKIQCPCGSGKLRTIKSLNMGFAFCAPAGICSAAKKAVSANCVIAATKWDKKGAAKKRATTNKTLYGVSNAGQTASAKAAHKSFYADPVKVAEAVSRYEATCLENFGFKNPQQCAKIKAKSIATLLRTHGVENVNQKHISPESFAIMSDKLLLEEFLKNHTIDESIAILGTTRVTLFKYHDKHGLNVITRSKSKYEDEIEKFLLDSQIAYSKNNRKILGGKELDFYIQPNNFAIEVHGLYWHSESTTDRKLTYHNDKRVMCENLGINLIQIFVDELIESPAICKSIINQNLGIGQKIAGRNCICEEVKNVDLREFLDANHLQGWVNGSKAYVLKYNDEIVAAMTFGRPRYNKKAEWELLRLAFKNDMKIIGGSEKLWKFVLSQLNPNSIVSYCDRRWFTGKVYEKLGFDLTVKGKPTYWYTDYKKRWHRSKYTKKNLLKLSKNLISNPKNEDWTQYSEMQITRDILGLDRIWDCGQDTWIWNKIKV
jgi:hypothetical protein